MIQGCSSFSLRFVHWFWDWVRTRRLWFLLLGLHFGLQLVGAASAVFPGPMWDRWSICPLCLKFVSDVVVRCFALRLSQFYLQGHEGAHGHMEEDLPHVPQFVQIHVGQTDECKRQEGLTVPPHREVGKQVALKGERRRIGMLHTDIDIDIDWTIKLLSVMSKSVTQDIFWNSYCQSPSKISRKWKWVTYSRKISRNFTGSEWVYGARYEHVTGMKPILLTISRVWHESCSVHKKPFLITLFLHQFNHFQ